MPTLTSPNGWSLTWDDSTPTAAPLVPVTNVPPDVATLIPEALGPSQTAEDVKVALNTVPPKWVATGLRFAKTLAAAGVAAFVATGGTIEGVFRDPTAFFTALGTAVFMAVQKFLSWKD